MSTAELLSLISLISYILAGVFLVVALFFWFYFKIPSVIGDLSGRTAKKSIEKMRRANEKTGSKSYRASAVNAARGPLTHTMSGLKNTSSQPEYETAAREQDMPQTGVLEENRVPEVSEEETRPLVDPQATQLLEDGEETVLLAPIPEKTGGVQITLLHELMFVHTDEVIEGC